jgi:hypothetical protein
MRLAALLLLLPGILLADAALAQNRSFCCADASGRQQCGDALPPACYGRAYREIDPSGRTVRRVDAPLTPEQKAQKAKELALQKEIQRQAEEETRRNRALLNTYSSERDIDVIRDRTLAELEKSVKDAQDKLADAKKRREKLAADAEFYKKKGIPPDIKHQIQENEADIQAKEKELQAKEQEREDIRKRFAEEKQRYQELTKGRRATAPGTSSSADNRPR